MTGRGDDASVEGDAASIWAVKLRTAAPLSDGDSRALREWLAANGDNEPELSACLHAWDAMASIADVPEILQMRADALDHPGRRDRLGSTATIGRARMAHVAAAAAAVVLILAMEIGLKTARGSPPQILATGLGQRSAIRLQDGSSVSLDSRSQVMVSLSDKQRALTLGGGRAKFDVAHDRHRPFTVRVGSHIVIATGTSFSTELLNGKLHVVLYNGSVAILDGEMPDPQTLLSVREHPGRRAIRLHPGQEFVGQADGAGGVVRIGPPSSLSWEHGVLDFSDSPLGDAVAQLNRYSTDIIFVEGKRAAAIKVNGVFQAGKSTPFLQAISALYPVRVKRLSPHRYQISM